MCLFLVGHSEHINTFSAEGIYDPKDDGNVSFLMLEFKARKLLLRKLCFVQTIDIKIIPQQAPRWSEIE